MSAADDEGMDLPPAALIRLAHASAQSVADLTGVRVLHIKGASLDPELNPGRSLSSDADVLVHPADVPRYTRALSDNGWLMWCDFDEGSMFEHAASFHHRFFGMLDVHQNFPGLHRDPTASFETLWRNRVSRDIAAFDCQAPGPVGEHLVMLLHAGRTPGKQRDIENHWTALDSDARTEVETLAAQLGGTVGLAAALGRLDEVDDPEAALWRLMKDNSDRLGEWRARWQLADSPGARFALARRALRVNRFQLGQNLGHPPSRAEIRREWWRRAGAGVRSAARLGRSRT